MREQITLDEALGKTLKHTYYSMSANQLALLFDGGTFVVLGIDKGFEEGDETVAERTIDLDYFGDALLVESGIATKEEVEAKRAEQAAARTQQSEVRDRKEYARLKARFEL